MSSQRCHIAGVVEWAMAGQALEGDVSGDQGVVAPSASGAALAVIDGLGHGHEAAVAARIAASIVQAQPTLPVSDLIAQCHDGLQKTRGAVMSLAILDARLGLLDWCGVGNVEAAVFEGKGANRAHESIPLRGGVVGYRLPPLKVNTLRVSPGALLVMATDGIGSDFLEHVDPAADVDESAELVLMRSRKGTDDALVLIARYLGAPA